MCTDKKESKTAQTPPLVLARIAGFLYLVMVPLGLFGYMYIPSLIVPEDVVATVNNIIASGPLFNLSIVSVFTVHIVNIFLVLVLYKLLRPVNKNHALSMVIFLLVATPIAMLNQFNNFAVLILSNGADYLSAFTIDQLHSQVMLFLELHRYGSQIAGIFFGLWLFPMGYLVFKSGYIPRILGILLMIGCFGYLFDSFAIFLMPNFDTPIALYTCWGEVLFPLWLLIKGVNVEQ